MLSAAELPWPAVDGVMQGDFTPLAVKDAPALQWKMEVASPDAVTRTASFAMNGPGLRLAVTARIDARTSDGEWRIEESGVDLPPWFALVADDLGLQGADISGRITLTGGGPIRQGRISGSALAAMSGGSVKHEKKQLELSGIDVRVEFPSLPTLAASGSLVIREGRAGAVPVRDGRIDFALDENGDIEVREARLAGMGGTLSVRPFRVEAARPEVGFTIDVISVSLEEIIALIPAALSEAHGRLTGEVTLGWRAGEGLKFGRGKMQLAGGGKSSVRLARLPGLLTGQLSPPASGMRARLHAMTPGLVAAPKIEDNPAYPALRRVEIGQTPILIEALDVRFDSKGDLLGRTATLRLEGRPDDPNLIAPVTVELNLSGPLDRLLSLGFDERMKFGNGR